MRSCAGQAERTGSTAHSALDSRNNTTLEINRILFTSIHPQRAHHLPLFPAVAPLPPMMCKELSRIMRRKVFSSCFIWICTCQGRWRRAAPRHAWVRTCGASKTMHSSGSVATTSARCTLRLPVNTGHSWRDTNTTVRRRLP